MRFESGEGVVEEHYDINHYDIKALIFDVMIIIFSVIASLLHLVLQSDGVFVICNSVAFVFLLRLYCV